MILRIEALKSLVLLAESNCKFDSHKLLGIPRSTLWGHINEIEKKTNVKIINRAKGNNFFTHEGLCLVPYAQEIIRTYEEGLSKALSRDSSELSGTLVISTTVAVASAWLMSSIRDFRTIYPALVVNVTALDDIDNKTENFSDILLRPISEKYTNKFDKVWYTTYEHGLYASQTYLDRKGTPVKSNDLQDHLILAYGDSNFTGFEDINWHIKGKWQDLPKLIPYLTINSTSSLTKAATEGLGIAPCVVQANAIYKTNLVRILPHISGPLVNTYFCVRNNLHPAKSKAAYIFGSYFREYLARIGINVYDEVQR